MDPSRDERPWKALERALGGDGLHDAQVPQAAVDTFVGEVNDVDLLPPDRPAAMRENAPPRQRLLQLIETLPGVHIRLAQRILGVSVGTVVYHMRVLLRRGEIRREEQGRYVRLYPARKKEEGLPAKLAQKFWRLRSPAKRILDVLESEPLRLTEVAERAGVSKQLAHYHLQRMVDAGEVSVVGERAKRYTLSPSDR